MTEESKLSLHLDINKGLDNVTELVQTRLIECGWQEKVRKACQTAFIQHIEENNKMPSVDELIMMITPLARSLVPDGLKKDLVLELEKIFNDLDNSGYKDHF